MKKYFLLIFGFTFLVFGLYAQEEKPKNWQLSGYLKNMQTLAFFNNSFPTSPTTFKDTFLLDNLIHHRLNFTWYPSSDFTFRADLRTRAFFGDFVKSNPFFAEQVDDANNDFFDLSLVLVDKPSYVLHTMLDRLYLEYVKNNWELRLGRQRVNWGISTIWNPNDIFNAYDFTDFDYEERPGSDALRVKYYTGFASSLEFVTKIFDDIRDATIAGMWKWNKWNYDFQLLAGYMERDLTIGGGWAGNVKNASFKGEMTYFHALYEDGENAFAFTFGFDYSFSNSLYLNTGFLYNSLGSTDVDVNEIFTFQLSAKNLYPYKYSVLIQSSYPFSPLLNGGVAIIYSLVDVHPLFFNPTLTVSVAENWDFDFVGQLVFNVFQGKICESYSGYIPASEV